MKSLLALALCAAPVLAWQADPGALADLQPGRNFPTAQAHFGGGRSWAIETGDVDLDGDLDVVIANGGDNGPQANRLYLNQGGLQGGVQGNFVDGTASQLLGVPDDKSRDIDFADVDGDGDLDLFVCNDGSTVQGGGVSRAYVNLGGRQLGIAGQYNESTDSFWGNLVSVPVGAQVVGNGTGPFRDYSFDAEFGDVDLDGDLDLMHLSSGPNIAGTSDSRVFLNDGAGRFDELWPWADGAADIQLHAMDVELVDLDDDWDLDIMVASRDSQSRLYRNDLAADGSWPGAPFTDVTQSAFVASGATQSGNLAYEVEFGDLDGDGDFDLWMTNYQDFSDKQLENRGGLVFSERQWQVGELVDEMQDADLIDYDGDGDLDVALANFTGTNVILQSGLAQGFVVAQGLYHNTSGAGGALAAGPETPTAANGGTSYDFEVFDADGDGDEDLALANDGNQNNRYWENTLGLPDSHAPTIHRLTVQGDKADGSDTPIRVALRDNSAHDVIERYVVELFTSVDGGVEHRQPMASQGSQQFQATIPGGLDGTIAYRVEARDRAGNAVVSPTHSYVQTSGGAPLLTGLGSATPGQLGRPYLTLAGAFTGGSVAELQVVGGAPGALTYLFASDSSTPTPFKGGLLYTVPILVQVPFTSQPSGQVFLSTVWPAGLPAGSSFWFQLAFQDASAFGGASLSNAVRLISP